jgi:2-isopropylmalate synthase
MTPATSNEYIHDWNLAAAPAIPHGTSVLLNDETLRDGLQNPSVHDPTINEKIEILHLMESLGIEQVNIGLPRRRFPRHRTRRSSRPRDRQ